MELMLTRERLQFESPAAQGGEQITIEGEATLAGSMRDAVTVLSVQAQAHLTGAQAIEGAVRLSGHVSFQALYTQGDLTRVRTLETGCDFEHDIRMESAAEGMRVEATCSVEQTEGSAANGRMTLRALLGVQATALRRVETEYVAGVEEAVGSERIGIQSQRQTIAFCRSERLGEGSALLREEFDIPAKAGAGEALGATATAEIGEIAGGSGRVSVSGSAQVRVMHRPEEAGDPFVTTTHELPFEISVETPGWIGADGVAPTATAEVTDVMADCVPGEKRWTLRLEAEVRVAVSACANQQTELLADLYSTSGPELEPIFEEIDALTFEEDVDARESLRIQASLPQDALPIDTVLAVFAQPTLTGLSPAGRRLNAEGIMSMTLIYLPVDSDIPCGLRLREPFSMTFPTEAAESMQARLQCVETTAGATTSDRAEVRCVLRLSGRRRGIRQLRAITAIAQREAAKQEHGFILVWPQAGETRWQTARKLRVAESSLRSAGKNAVMAFRK